MQRLTSGGDGRSHDDRLLWSRVVLAMTTRAEDENRLLDRLMLTLEGPFELDQINVNQRVWLRGTEKKVDDVRPVMSVHMSGIKLADRPAVLASADRCLLPSGDLLNHYPKVRANVALELTRGASEPTHGTPC